MHELTSLQEYHLVDSTHVATLPQLHVLRAELPQGPLEGTFFFFFLYIVLWTVSTGLWYVNQSISTGVSSGTVPILDVNSHRWKPM